MSNLQTRGVVDAVARSAVQTRDDLVPTSPVPRPEHPRPEHPRPQWTRGTWMSLNGEWQFELDPGDSGLERGLLERPPHDSIVVPFAPESAASGVGITDFMEAVWYRREVTIPADWAGLRVHLHLGAVDHDATVWVGSHEVAHHRGGYTSFTADLSGLAVAGEPIVLTVRARDPRRGVQARGKQATGALNSLWNYTRTTGIWQSVWLEAVPPVFMHRPKITPQVGTRSFLVTVPVSANRSGHTVRARLSDRDGDLTTVVVPADVDRSPTLVLTVPAHRARLWSPSDPHLYDLCLELVGADGVVVDRAWSYAGLRSVSIDGSTLRLNGSPVFQRLVLDQGYWPESLMTAPDDAALARDIELAIAAGFNGARLHQKVVEERYLFHADRLGFLLWEEFADWGSFGMDLLGQTREPTPTFVTQWTEVVDRDYNHPSVIGWCPLNETHQHSQGEITVLDDVTHGMYQATKLADSTRPVLDVSGFSHLVTDADVYDAHDYAQDGAVLARNVAALTVGAAYSDGTPGEAPFSVPYRGQPFLLSEFGGIWWNPDAVDSGDGIDGARSWGYGHRVRDEDDFHARFTALTGALLADPRVSGYCYTQLTDVFQEQNGIYRFDRSRKLDVERIRRAQQRPAAVERPAGTPAGAFTPPGPPGAARPARGTRTAAG